MYLGLRLAEPRGSGITPVLYKPHEAAVIPTSGIDVNQTEPAMKVAQSVSDVLKKHVVLGNPSVTGW